MEQYIWLIIPLFLVVFVLFWSFICWLISLMSGWQQLAKIYPASGSPPGRMLHGQAAHMRGSRYGGVLKIGFTPQGLYLDVNSFFRPGHRPLLIDWGAFGPVETVKGYRGANHATTIALGNGHELSILFANPKVTEAIESAQAGEVEAFA